MSCIQFICASYKCAVYFFEKVLSFKLTFIYMNKILVQIGPLIKSVEYALKGFKKWMSGRKASSLFSVPVKQMTSFS